MKIIVPFFREVHPVLSAVLRTYVPDARPVELFDDDDYRLLLQRLWSEREPVMLIEHDVLPWPGAMEELWQCPCRWGAYSYRIHGGIGIAHAFGCTKFTPALMDAVPDIWNEPGRWCDLDQRLFFAARGKGHEPHLHRPPVIHLNPRELK